ncbi:MAG TPA: thermonuclease family protein [Pyrinomonadaceae bacterium]|nr:thermonuclease family protein [Pyrinomonadaceae bacterium]
MKRVRQCCLHARSDQKSRGPLAFAAVIAAAILLGLSMSGCVISRDSFGGGTTADQQASPAQFISERTSQEITGQVSAITDGDTILIVDENEQQHKVKLAGIESPNGDQELNERARQNLFSLIYGKTVHVLTDTTDENGRLVGKVTAGNCDLSLEQIKSGFAWFDRSSNTAKSAADRKAYTEAESTARTAKLNLWSKPGIQPPSEAGEPSAAPVEASIVGNKNSLIYHWAGCRGYEKVSSQNRVTFGSWQEAENAGYRAAKNCSASKPGGKPNDQQTASLSAPSEVANTQPSELPSTETSLSNSNAARSSTGATARCRDGAFNYSQTRRGACSGHGGVAEWLTVVAETAKATTTVVEAQTPAKQTSSSSDYTLGPRGGCYHLSDSGRKVYVDKSLCS